MNRARIGASAGRRMPLYGRLRRAAGLFALLATQLGVAGAALASEQGPRNPATVDDDPAGGIGWLSPQNAAVSDNQYATVSAFPGSGDSDYLRASDFGFTIPAGATIDGIKVAVEVTAVVCPGVSIVEVLDARIVKGGVIGATNRAADFTVDGDFVLFGDASDLWGETWTAADINAADFGFVFRLHLDGPGDCSPLVLVDSISITVFYGGCGDGQL